ncbi:hypothetical protein BDV3_007033 [Batrachochytrium dendrobatidis]|nr:OPT super [Batrachochytrium dendrobatidis]KAK5668122.1 OPT superfamily [Batrachochytrium dendrobatidis]
MQESLQSNRSSFAGSQPETYYYKPNTDVENFDSIESFEEINVNFYTKGVVPETDDPDEPSLTIRMLFLGTIWGIILGLGNGVLNFRTNPIGISSIMAALMSFPIGIFMAKLLPKGIWNPGPFGLKEHALVFVIASAAGGSPYGIESVVGQMFPKFLNDTNITFWNSLLFVVTTQMMGYGLAGITRKFLVQPSSMYWPTVLPTVALFTSLHETHDSSQKKSTYWLSRSQFFWIAFIAIFIWEWVPLYFVSAAQSISILCLLSSNKIVRFLGSSSPDTGPGVLSLSLDWSNITGFAPLSCPFWASLNLFVANVIGLWVVLPVLYYTNAFGNPSLEHVYSYSDKTPFPRVNSVSIFQKNGTSISPTIFYNTTTYDLDETIYNRLQPIYITENFALSYSIAFFNVTCSISHILLWYNKDVIRQAKELIYQKKESGADIHSELMKAYPEIPEWVYLLWLLVWATVQIFVGIITPFKLDWWGSFFSIFVSMVFLIPYGIIQASTGQSLGLNILSELLMGLIMPGHTIQIMTFKTLAQNTISQALTLSADLKLGRYLHINPIHMVFAQLYGTVIGAVTNTASVWIALKYFPLDTPDWEYTSHQIFFNAGAIWGAIGPARFFGQDSPYYSLNLAYSLGLVLPVIPWVLNLMIPHPYWRYIHFPVMSTVVNCGMFQSGILSSFILAFVFQFLIVTYHHTWWQKYNYVLSAALDGGSGLAIVAIVLASSWHVMPSNVLNAPLVDYYCTGMTWDQF